jgi:bifunctional lysine-specific demethylase and histidyl-hydroxylase NO66
MGRALARAIEPVAEDRFFAEYWEQRPLVVERDEPGRFTDLLSVDDVERVISTSAVRAPAFRLVKAGAQLAERDYTVDIPWRPSSLSGTVDVHRAAAEFAGGATIVLQALHVNWAPLARYCRGLESELGHPAQANAYYTPASAQGFAVHHDTHEVLCLQVAGEKRWLVYEPVWELPLKRQAYSKELGAPGEPVLDLTLHAGDTLYLPRGWLHEAATSETDSLHITVGINVRTWHEALRDALEDCREELEFRRSVPATGEMSADLLELLRERLRPERVAQRMRSKLVATRRPLRSDALAQARAAEGLALETTVQRRETVLFDVAERDGRILLSFEGKQVSLPGQARAAVEAAASAAEPFRPADLPGLDEAGRVVLARRLVREGFLQVSSGPGPRNGRGPRTAAGAQATKRRR